MSHEVESMFYVGEVPWHKLGVSVKNAPTIEEAIKLAGLDWKVGLKELITKEGGQDVPAQATFRESDGRILGVVGPTYKPLQNAEAFKFFEPFLASGQANLETAGSLRNGQRVWILAKINRPDSVIVPEADDRVAKYLLLSNSHDGTLAIRVGFTPIRVVCANTLAMSIGDKSGQTQLLKVHHKGNVVATLEKIREIINLADQRFESTAEQYRQLAKTPIDLATLEKYVKIVFATKHTEDKPESEETKSRVFPKIRELFENGRGNNLPGVKGTLWAAYNAVTEYIQYERGKDAANRLNETWYGQGMQLNKKALETAVTIAKVAAG